MLLVGIALVGGVGSGLANFGSDMGDSSACPVDAEAFTAGCKEVRGEPEGDQRFLRFQDRGSMWSDAHWLSDLGIADPTRADEAHRGTSTSVVLEVQRQLAGHGHGLAGVDEIRAYAYGAFQELGLDADYAWEVLRCESDRFDPDVIYGPRTGSFGEIGIGQLKPNGGLLEDFYDQGYQDPWDPFQQIDYISWKVSREGWWAWSCAY